MMKLSCLPKNILKSLLWPAITLDCLAVSAITEIHRIMLISTSLDRIQSMYYYFRKLETLLIRM
jgi:hypothetical protein